VIFVGGLLGVMCLSLTACGQNVTSTPQISSERPPNPPQVRNSLKPCSLPDAAGAGAAVQKQLQDRHSALMKVMQDPAASNEALAAAYGDLGKILMSAEYRDGAEPCFLDAEALSPGEWRWPYYLGRLYEKNGDGAKAAAAFERAYHAKADDVPTLVALGDAYLDQGRVPEAEPLFAKALSLQPTSVPAIAGSGRVALAKRDYPRAIEQLERALSLDPRAGVIHYPLAMAYRGMGDADKAQAQLDQQNAHPVRVSDPLMDEVDALAESAAAYEVRGVRALDDQRWAAAVDFFRKAVALDPNEPRFRHKLGTALSLAGNPAAAVQQFEEITRRWPSYSKAQFSLGVMLASAGRYREAIPRYQAALKGEPGYVEAELQLAEALRASGAAEASLAHYKEVASLDPRLPEAPFGYAMALLRLNRYSDAKTTLIETLRTFPEQPVVALALARLLAAAPDDRVRDGRRALVLAQQLASQLRPNVALLETMAMALAETGQYAAAVKAQRDAIAAMPPGVRGPLPRMIDNLELYEHDKPCRTPFGDEAAVITL
jgi:tetratricopeptide (TPR) repeat protein